MADIIQKIFAQPSWDVMASLALLAILFFYGLARGKGRIAALVIYTYVALAIFTALPIERIAGFIPSQPVYIVKSAIFLALFLLLALLLGSKGKKGFAGVGGWWQTLILSLVEAGFLSFILIGFLPDERVQAFIPIVQKIFLTPAYRLPWMVAPMALVVLLRWWERKGS